MIEYKYELIDITEICNKCNNKNKHLLENKKCIECKMINGKMSNFVEQGL